MIEAQTREAQELSVWGVLLIILLCSLAGELYRADKSRYITQQLLWRVGIRAFTSTMIGVIASSYCIHKGMDIYAVGAVAGGLSLLGADMVITIGTVLIKRKVNIK